MKTLAEAGGSVLAVEAGKTILVDAPQVLAFARAHHLTLVAIDQADVTCHRQVA